MNTSRCFRVFRSVPHSIAGLTLLAFMALVFMGIFDCMNPIMQSHMSVSGSHLAMADCIPGENCGMDINTHIQIWKGMITTNLSTGFSGLLMSMLVVVFVFGMRNTLFVPHVSSRIARYLYYDRDHRESTIYNYFIRIFSKGILQPKIFAL